MFNVYHSATDRNLIYVIKSDAAFFPRVYKGVSFIGSFDESGRLTSAESVTLKELLEIYNALLGTDRPPVKKFQDRATAEKRLADELARCAVAWHAPEEKKDGRVKAATAERPGQFIERLYLAGTAPAEIVRLYKRQFGKDTVIGNVYWYSQRLRRAGVANVPAWPEGLKKS
jgi:hypothetical protein